MRRPAKRTVACVWAALVVTGGGLTLWLQDGTQDAPVSWQEVEPQPDRAPPGGSLIACEVGQEPVEEGPAGEIRTGDIRVVEDDLTEAQLEIILCAGPE